MDEKIREIAKSKFAEAERRNKRGFFEGSILSAYLDAIGSYLSISNKNVDDFQTLASAYYSIATIYFNQRKYKEAAESYVGSIQQLCRTELDDDAYRTLTKRYIDLADTGWELVNQPIAIKAISHAMKAFRLIKQKTDEEKALGDPASNFLKFRDYYERKLSTNSYRQSPQFINHWQLLAQGQNTESNETEEESLERMLEQLAVSQPSPQQLFPPVLVNQPPSDDQYRQLAQNFLSLVQPDSQKKYKIATYNQVIAALNSIKVRHDGDNKIIEDLKGRISALNNTPLQAPSSTFFQTATFFGHNPLQTTEFEPEDNNTEMSLD